MTHGPEHELYLAEECWLDGNSNLVLRTRWNPTYYGSTLFNFTSCWVDSLNKAAGELTYGRFDIRAKLPNPKALDVWPTVWLLDDNHHCWPVGGEIDIVEAVGGFASDAMFGTYHYGSSCNNDSWAAHGKYNQDYPNITNGQAPIDFSQDYHVFSVEWNATSISWFVDGNFYEIRTAGDNGDLFIPSWPMYLIFNVAIAQWTGPQPPLPDNWPTFMYIDYIKVWQEPAHDLPLALGAQ